MKIAFFSYPSSFQNVGGGEIQLLKMREYIQKEGVDVHLFDMWRDRIEDFEVLHVFCSVKDCLGLVQVAKKRGVRVVISPQFWSSWERAFFTYGSFQERTQLAARHALKLICPTFPSARRKLMMLSDAVFANSVMEKEQLHRLFAIPKEKLKVVHNATDEKFLKSTPDLYRSRFGSDPFILSVGRIEPRKNQLNLIRATKDLHLPLVLIGAPVSGYESYYEACQREGKGRVKFLGNIPHEDPLLSSAYAASDCFVLPAWFETPGLVAMEAVLAGTRVVVTSGGATREYFKDYVYYFRPSRVQEMRNAILKALSQPKENYLREHIRSHFTWTKIARDALRVYQTLSAARPPSTINQRIS